MNKIYILNYLYNFRNGKKQGNNNNESNPFDDHDEEWDENSENVLTDNGNFYIKKYFSYKI